MDTETGIELLVGLAVLVGVAGVVIPVLPGALLAWGAIAVWAALQGDTVAWVTLAVATLLVGGAQLVKYLVPHRRLRDAGVPRSSLVGGGLIGVVGFFVVPVVGLVVGFVAGVYVAEQRRHRSREAAWASTRAALRAVGLAVLIELAGVLLAGGSWLAAAVAT